MSPKPGNRSSAPSVMENTAEAVAARLRESLLQNKGELEVNKFFRALVKLEGSDLHLKVGQPPMVRTRGELKALNAPPIEIRGNGQAVIAHDGRAKSGDL